MLHQTVNENWVKEETMHELKKRAEMNLKKVKEMRKGKKVVYVKHPTAPNCLIEKIIE